MSNPDLLSPDSSPGKVNAGRTGVRRVNNMPMVFMAVAGAIFLGAMAAVAWDRSNQNQAAAKPVEKAGDSIQAAVDLVGDRKDGIVQVKRPEPPPPELAMPLPSGLPMAPPPPLEIRDENAERLKAARMARLEAAAKAKTRLDGNAARADPLASGAPRSREEAATRMAELSNDPTAMYRRRLAQLQSSGLLPAGAGAPGANSMASLGALGSMGAMGGTSGIKKVSDISQFDNTTGTDRWRLGAEVQAPRTPYELRAGFIIPATLISGINSELPGQIVAQVAQDVYDTATGKFKLVPQGSRLVGSYAAEPSFGQSRVLVAWQRIVFPDGKALDIGSMPGADSAGYGGLNDKVDNHYFRVFGSALLMSGVVAGVSYSQNQNQNQGQSGNGTNNRQTAGSALSEAVGQQLGLVMAQMIAKNLNVSPTLEIRPGFRFNVIVTKDLTFTKPYSSFDY